MTRPVLLFEKDDLPRAEPVKRMHVVDAGHLANGAKGIEFECSRCGHNTGWILDEWTISENKRGRPCPRCNGRSGTADQEPPK